TDVEEERLALDAGARRFLVKPIAPAELVSVLLDVIADDEGGSAPLAMAGSVEFLERYNEVLVAKLERKMAQAERTNRELELAQHRLERLLEASPTVLYSLRLDPEGLVPVWVSENVVRIFGYTPE